MEEIMMTWLMGPVLLGFSVWVLMMALRMHEREARAQRQADYDARLHHAFEDARKRMADQMIAFRRELEARRDTTS